MCRQWQDVNFILGQSISITLKLKYVIIHGALELSITADASIALLSKLEWTLANLKVTTLRIKRLLELEQHSGTAFTCLDPRCE